MLLLDNPLLEIEKEFDELKFCHTLCTCHDTLALCGAFKPVKCGILCVDTEGMDKCPVCLKAFCPDCENVVKLKILCSRCGS